MMSRAPEPEPTKNGARAATPPPEGILALGGAWVIGWSPPVLFTLFHQQPSESDFARFIEAQCREIDDWPLQFRRTVVHHATASGRLSAAQRQLAADMVAARRSKLGTICLGYVFCTTSGLTRGVSKVINWLAPPPYPTHHALTVGEGLCLLRELDPRIDPDILLGRYESLFGAYLPKHGRR